MTRPTWRPARPYPFDLDAEADRVCAEAWASDPRPDRIVVSVGDLSRVVGVPRVEAPEMFRASVRDALREMAERGV